MGSAKVCHLLVNLFVAKANLLCASPALQGLLLRSGVLGWVVPLLLAFDNTHDEGEGGGGLPPALDIGQGGRSVPDFLGLGVDRPNMQVGGRAGLGR